MLDDKKRYRDNLLQPTTWKGVHANSNYVTENIVFQRCTSDVNAPALKQSCLSHGNHEVTAAVLTQHDSTGRMLC